MSVRRATHAGTWYSADSKLCFCLFFFCFTFRKVYIYIESGHVQFIVFFSIERELSTELEGWLSKASNVKCPVKAVIAP